MKALSVYKGKKVLITGHTGFKGGWLSIWLNMLGAEVYGYALDPFHENGIFSSSKISNKINDFRADIRDQAKLTDYICSIKPDFIFHLAAQALVLESYSKPSETFEINTQGTVNILDALRNCPSVKAAVFITTDKCYENREWIWAYRENEALGGHDPYSASKAAAEIAIASYRKSFFNKPGMTGIASARAGNVIGGGDWADYRLVPDIFRAIKAGKNIELRNPDSVRPWQHVLEPLGGYLLLGAKLWEDKENFAEAWNFGPFTNDVHSVADLVTEIAKYKPGFSSIDISKQEKQHEANLLMLDISKAGSKLGWQPLLSFSESIKMTADWYLNYRSSDVYELSKNQILSYQNTWSLRNGN